MRADPLPTAAAVLFALRPSSAVACPVCFGSSDPQVLSAFYFSAAMLTLLPFVIIGLTIGSLLYFHRRAAKKLL